MSNTRPELSENAYRRYEPLIREALRIYPAQITFNPTDVKISTFVSRLRDAVRSLILHRWPTDFDTSNAKNLVVTSGDNGVSIRGPVPKDTKLVKATGTVEAGLSGLTDEQITAFCFLLDAKLLKGPVIFMCMRSLQTEEWERKFDVSFTKNENEYIIL